LVQATTHPTPGALPARGAKCDLDLAVALYDVVRGVRRLQDDDPVDVIDAHLLVRVKESGVMRASDLAASVGLDLSTISRRLARLEHQGLLQRAPDPDDARASRLTLSQAGTRVLGDVIANRAHVLHDALADWDVSARTELAALLRRLADDLAGALKNA
jgi:DNA-binding MarR family transcriptional regulator